MYLVLPVGVGGYIPFFFRRGEYLTILATSGGGGGIISTNPHSINRVEFLYGLKIV